MLNATVPSLVPASPYKSATSPSSVPDQSQIKMSNPVLTDIKGKIDREKKLIQGFQSLKKNTNNPEVIQRCNNQIRETQSNIDYLQETMAKLSVNDSSSDNSNPTHSRPVYTRFDLIKYDGPSLGHRIQYMLQQLEFKLQVENQYKQANEKISQLYLMDGDRSSSIAAEGGRVESDQRIQLLIKALKRYQDMHVNIEEVTRDMEIMNTPKYARKPLSGKLFLTITCVRDIDHIASPMFSKRPESVVIIKVDDVEKAKTKGSRSGKWNEEFVIDVDKSNELEFSVYDKSGSSLVPVAITWALLSDIAEELRKKKVANEAGNEGWISASNLSNPNSSSFQSDSGVSSFPNSGASTGQTSVPGSNFDNNFQSGPSSGGVGSGSSDTKQVQINTWINLEPVGQMLISLSFDKSNQSGRKQLMGALGRQGAIRQKKEEVFDQHGHQFVQKQFYNIMCCSLCGEFLRYTGFQCQDCRLLCHKKCYQKVVTKCISKSSSDLDSDEAKLNHRIPHRFEPTLNRGTRWCCHCGYILPWGRKNVRKCTECGVMCHTQCTHLVPDFCGMSMDMANKILATIKSTPKPAARQTPSAPAVPTTTRYNDQSLSSSGFPPMETTPMSSNTLSKVPSESASEALKNISDDEADDFNSKLPTATSNQYQTPVSEHPYKQVGRRPPPPELLGSNSSSIMEEQQHQQAMAAKQQQQQQYQQQMYQQQLQQQQNAQNRQSAMEPGDYTFVSTKSEDMLASEDHRLSKNPFEDNNNSQFQNFDYHNSQTQQVIAPNSQAGEETVTSKDRSSHKSKKRRRKVGLDDFQFLAVLGKGNFGKVMLAESRHTNKLCAIKVLKKDFIVENDEAESVKSEKRVFLTANKEMHPFLLNLHCCFQTENRIYFVMEYISGGDLMWHIQKSRFSAKRAKFYACEVLLALKYFHDNGIVYRDLKLDNILLTAQGHIKIADYGLCKENMYFKSTTGTFCGTPEFMAPEIISGKQYERSVDWWALGVLLFQMLLCQSPFKGDDEDEIFNAIEHDDVKYPISMPRQTVLVLQALLTKDADQRLGSSERDALEVMEHPYFQDVNFDDVFNCRIQPPYLPELSSEHDYSNFDKEFTSETPRLTPVETVLTSEMQEQFRGFSHISEDAVV